MFEWCGIRFFKLWLAEYPFVVMRVEWLLTLSFFLCFSIPLQPWEFVDGGCSFDAHAPWGTASANLDQPLRPTTEWMFRVAQYHRVPPAGYARCYEERCRRRDASAEPRHHGAGKVGVLGLPGSLQFMDVVGSSHRH
jgi:hypothetical protein